jgi:hypothetical protein
MFRIIGKKGFHITFENGYTVSVQFGPGNYCDNYHRNIGIEEEVCGREGSSTAEGAVWPRNGELLKHKFFDGDIVGNRMEPKEVLALMNWASKQK